MARSHRRCLQYLDRCGAAYRFHSVVVLCAGTGPTPWFGPTFIVLFAIGISLTTAATKDSMFASTAAYAAVLVVFVSGNLGSTNTGSLTGYLFGNGWNSSIVLNGSFQ